LAVNPVEVSPESIAEQPPASSRDPEARALRRLAAALGGRSADQKPLESLQIVVDLAREMTRARYAALAVTDSQDRTEGFVTSGLTAEELRGLRAPPQAHGPLGSLRGDGRPVRIDDLSKHPASFGFPPRHPQMKSMLGVPIWTREEVRGSLYVTDKDEGQPFSSEDEVLLSVLARHAANVIAKDWY
jgi:two-component system sensor histidine kinase DevS